RVHAAIARSSHRCDIAFLILTGTRADHKRYRGTACRRNKRPVYKVVEPLQVCEIDDSVGTIGCIRVGAVDIPLKTCPRDKLGVECTDVRVVTAWCGCDTREVRWTNRPALIGDKSKALALVDCWRQIRAKGMCRRRPGVQ